MENWPTVSLVIPVRNEYFFIDRLVESLLNQDYPKDKMEIIFVDGESDDGTYEKLLNYQKDNPHIKILKNPYRTTPYGLNIGVKNSSGELILVINGHSLYPPDYVRKNVEYKIKSGADNVGGVLKTVPANDSKLARAIAVAMSNPFGVGNSYYRIGLSEPRYVDIVPNGCYHRSIFEKLGYYDEDLTRAQDFEFNSRLIRNGGKILLVPDICFYYYARESPSKLFHMLFHYGYFKFLATMKLGKIFTLRQIVPPLFVLGLLGGLVLAFVNKIFLYLWLLFILTYLTASLIISFFASRKDKSLFFYLPYLFFIMHFAYGIGYLKGLVDFGIFKKHKKKREDLLKIPTGR